MPQMAPMPWILILFSTLFFLFLVSISIYFSINVKNLTICKQINNSFNILW